KDAYPQIRAVDAAASLTRAEQRDADVHGQRGVAGCAAGPGEDLARVVLELDVGGLLEREVIRVAVVMTTRHPSDRGGLVRSSRSRPGGNAGQLAELVERVVEPVEALGHGHRQRSSSLIALVGCERGVEPALLVGAHSPSECSAVRATMSAMSWGRPASRLSASRSCNETTVAVVAPSGTSILR